MFQIIVLFISCICCVTYVKAFECGLLEHAVEENFHDAMKKCAAGDYLKDDTDSTESSEDLKSGTKVNKESAEDYSSHEEHANIERKNDTAVSENCVVQCIFTNFNMTDSNGYPTQQHITEGLLKYVSNTEAKYLLGGSVEECFHTITLGNVWRDKLNSCEYSNQLAKCLMEKLKTNCTDWEVTDLPIHQ